MVIGLENLRRELQSTCFQNTIPKSKTHFISYLNECRRSKRYVVIVGTDARQKPADAARRTLQFALGSFGRQSARGRGTEVVLGANSRKCLIPGEPEMAQYGGKAV